MRHRKGHKWNPVAWETRCTPIRRWVEVEQHDDGRLVCSSCGETVVSAEERNEALPDFSGVISGFGHATG